MRRLIIESALDGADQTSLDALKKEGTPWIARRESRIRANIERLSRGSDLYLRYVKSLSNEEDELAKLRDDIAKLRDFESAQRKDVAFVRPSKSHCFYRLPSEPQTY